MFKLIAVRLWMGVRDLTGGERISRYRKKRKQSQIRTLLLGDRFVVQDCTRKLWVFAAREISVLTHPQMWVSLLLVLALFKFSMPYGQSKFVSLSSNIFSFSQIFRPSVGSQVGYSIQKQQCPTMGMKSTRPSTGYFMNMPYLVRFNYLM